jgi:hypothetical protein
VLIFYDFEQSSDHGGLERVDQAVSALDKVDEEITSRNSDICAA